MTIIEYKDYLVKWLQQQVANANMKGLILGVSGGIDSALVANLIKEAFPNNHLGVIIPIYSSDADVVDAYSLVNACGINHCEMKLDAVYDQFSKLYEYQNPMSLANAKARLRMIQLYALASENDYLVVGTDNMCEWYTGFFTKYGDGGVDIAPLVHLNKAEVYEMASLYNVPSTIIEKQPSAGLISDISDEEEMGVSYEAINAYLNNEEIAESDRKVIERLHQNSEHKRNIVVTPSKSLKSS